MVKKPQSSRKHGDRDRDCLNSPVGAPRFGQTGDVRNTGWAAAAHSCHWQGRSQYPVGPRL